MSPFSEILQNFTYSPHSTKIIAFEYLKTNEEWLKPKLLCPGPEKGGAHAP
jgi:hypothetical protein